MSGTEFALHHLGHSAEVEFLCAHGSPRRRDKCPRLRARTPLSHPLRKRRRRSGLLVARIGGQVSRIVELGGIDKQAHYSDVVLADGPLHKRKMSVVQRSHRRHQADRLTVALGVRNEFFQFGSASYDQHK